SEGARRIIVGLGGSSTNDAGAGLLAALGAGPAEALARGGAALADATVADLGGLSEVRARFAGIDLVIASDVDSPLLGFKGTSAVHSPHNGAAPGVAQQLEAALGQFTETVGHAFSGSGRTTDPFGVDLLTGKPRRPEKEPGAGAGGGLGYALILLGGRRVSGVGAVLSAVGFGDAVAHHDLVVTGEGCLDWQSLSGKVVSGVAAAALAAATPSIVIAGQVMVGRRETMGLGVSGCYAVAETLDQIEAAMTDPVGTLRARAARVATTWSPRR
ncbi:MAG: glycerate kinase, partial [Nostocoides sp.]